MNIVSLTRPLAYIAACGVIALGLATAPSAEALVTSGNLADDEGTAVAVSLTDITEVPGDFNASFIDSDAAGSFDFLFSNETTSSILLTLVTTTINQTDFLFFTDGVTTTFDGIARFTAEKVFDSFELSTLVEAGTSVALSYVFGDPVGNAQSGAGPDIDFSISASVVPLPAGLVLFLSGLAGIGFLGRYNAKRRREPQLV